MSKRILIVDDEVAISWALKMALAEEGYFVCVKNKSEEGLAEFKKAAFDVVISDLRMPDMDGIEMLSEIRKIDARVKFIVMTAFPSLETALDAIRLKVEHYINKPFNVEEVKAMISKLTFEDFIKSEQPVLKEELPLTEKSEPKQETSVLDVIYLNRMKEDCFEKRVLFEAKIPNIYACKEAIEKELDVYLDEDQLTLLNTVILELLINGVKFAVTSSDSSELKRIELFYKITKDNCMIEVTYQNQHFAIDDIPDNQQEKRYEDILNLRQAGLFIVKRLADSFKVKEIKQDTKILVSKHIHLK